jgi:hypothetical protein
MNPLKSIMPLLTKSERVRVPSVQATMPYTGRNNKSYNGPNGNDQMMMSRRTVQALLKKTRILFTFCADARQGAPVTCLLTCLWDGGEVAGKRVQRGGVAAGQSIFVRCVNAVCAYN